MLFGLTSPKVSANTEPLSLQHILENTLTHHPKIEALEAKIDQSEAKQLQAQGAFDWQIEHLHQNRGSGYYDGWFSEQNFSRQLPFANSKVQVGYRNSEGTLPVYEEQHLTQNYGEPNLKLSMSLLRNRAIDPKRQALQEASLGVEFEKALQRLSLNELLAKAGNTYLDWYLSHQELLVAQELLKLAQTRNEGIVKRVAGGDLAKVVELEFQTTLLARRAKVAESQQKLLLNSLKLSLFKRDNVTGDPLNIDVSTPPATLETISQALDKALGNFGDIAQHPSLQALDFRAEQLQTQRKLSRTNLLPELDVNVTVARDFGDGSETLAGNESYVGLKLSAPIERRKAKGKLRAVEAELRALATEQRLTRENLVNVMQQQRSDLRNQQQLLKLHQEQALLAKRLAQVEVLRFQEGDSDLFLLNAREIASAQAQLRAAQTLTGILRRKLMALAQNGLLSEFTQELANLPSP